MATAATHESEKSIQLASLIMVISVLLSRVIGFVREWALARTVGASALTDVYSASFTIPDFLNYLMAAGALSITFIPILAQFIADEEKELGNSVFRSIATYMGLILIALIIIGMIFSRSLAVVVAPGFSEGQLDLLSTLLKIILPAQFFFYWGGLAIAVQYAHGQFFYAAVAPLIYNLGIIIFGVVFHKTWGVMAFSVGVLVGALCSHGLLQWIALKRLGYKIAPKFTLTEPIKVAMKRYLWLTFPIMLGFSMVVAEEWLSKYFASSLEPRSISWLHYARIEMRIPVAVIGGAAGIASFPYLSRLWAKGDFEQYTYTLLRQIQKLWATAPLAAILFYDHAQPITYFVFGATKFSPEDLNNTADALKMFSLGIFFWSVQMILSRGFYAAQKTWLPSLMGTIVCVLCIPLYMYLGKRFGFQGLALAGSIGIAVYATILWGMLKRHLKDCAPGVSLGRFYKFCFGWVLVLIVAVFLSHAINLLEIFQFDQYSALCHITVATAALILLGWGALRTVFVKLTDGKPLY